MRGDIIPNGINIKKINSSSWAWIFDERGFYHFSHLFSINFFNPHRRRYWTTKVRALLMKNQKKDNKIIVFFSFGKPYKSVFGLLLLFSFPRQKKRIYSIGVAQVWYSFRFSLSFLLFVEHEISTYPPDVGVLLYRN